MRSTAFGLVALLLVPACSATSPADRPGDPGPDAGPLRADDLSFPDLAAKDSLSADLGTLPDLEPAPDAKLSPDAFSASLTVTSSEVLFWKSSCASTPIESPVLTPGNYSVTLTASTLSKGTHKDDYLLIGLPIQAGSAQEGIRYSVLNGVGAKLNFTVDAPGVVRAWFLDSDHAFNTGTATAMVTPGDQSLVVAAATNVVAWQEDCKSTPAELELPAGTHRLTLSASSFSSGPGLTDAHVVLRLPLEGDESTKFISLNGVGDSKVVTIPAFGIVRAWLIAESQGAQSGQATVTVTAP